MSALDDGGPAFPSQNGHYFEPGMTLRDWFAGQALTGMLAQPLDSDCAFHPKLCAESAFEYADAMLAARNTLP